MRYPSALLFGIALPIEILLANELLSPSLNETVFLTGYTPLGAAARAMQTGWFSGPFPRFELGVVTLWILVLAPLVIKLFCWR